MKDNLIVIAFFLLSTIITGQTIQSDSLPLYVGKKITVCDVVIDAHRNKGSELTTFLNFGSPIKHWNVYLYKHERPAVN